AHRCEDVCKFGAISFDGYHVAHIDKSKCRECGACAKVCPYMAIVSRKRPCQNACKVKAISMNDDLEATIDPNKCIQCGACVYQCPFGAVSDKSYIVDAVNILNDASQNNGKVCAIVAPAIASQFAHAKLGQVVSGLHALGFSDVVEAALGADMVALAESQELAEKGILTSSCCPAFVKYIKMQFPQLVDKISHNMSPMATLAKHIKQQDESTKVIFVGPCTAKKAEAQLAEVKPYVDCVLTFEELQALFDSKDIDLVNLEETSLDNASYFGRLFAKSGGLSSATAQAMAEQDINFDVKPVVCDGIEACRMALLKLNKGVLDGNFIEGMACVGGCVGGAGNLTHSTEKSASKIEKHSQESAKKTIGESVSDIK
ncbi:MAG: 4Fe-4S binding protein, partial [Clostridia bacterium]|nr:4Fe-4S binding protein [Clostridia bacterium]